MWALLSLFGHKDDCFSLEHDGTHQKSEEQLTPSWQSDDISYEVIFEGSLQEPAHNSWQKLKCKMEKFAFNELDMREWPAIIAFSNIKLKREIKLDCSHEYLS